jgi:magnesium transporter
MKATLIQPDGTKVEAPPAQEVRERIEKGESFWFDIDGMDRDANDLLLNVFGFHPLAVRNAEQFGQRSKIEQFDDFTYIVVYGAQEKAVPPTVEVHIFFSSPRIVTVRRGKCKAVEDLRERIGQVPTKLSRWEISVLYLLLDTLIDSFFPFLAAFDDRIDELEDDILKMPSEQQLSELFEMKRTLVALRKAISPQRDMFASVLAGVTRLSILTTDDERYFRDLYDHLIRISDLIDSYRDLLTGAMDTHVSTVSNRLNVVMKQLAIIATIFLPLSFLTGFFGQNFTFMITHFLDHAWSFWALGIGLEALAVIVLMILFRRRGWLGGPTT